MAKRKAAARPDDGGHLAAIIRRAVLESGSSPYAVAKAAGVDAAILQRLVSGVRADLRLSTASRLCTALGLRLVSSGRPRSAARSRPAPPAVPRGSIGVAEMPAVDGGEAAGGGDAVGEAAPLD